MQFAMTPQQEQFRREVQAFFAEERVQRVLEQISHHGPRVEQHPEQIYRWLGERGWLAVNWPREYGGLDLGPIEAAIVTEEMCWNGVPDTAHVNTIDIVGQFLRLAGTLAQKQRYLPRMASGEIQVAVLYTEPDAASDLAALRTRAEFDGMAYRLYGTKIFNVKTQLSQYALCAARTRTGKTKYDGITMFMIPLEGSGVEVRPLWSMSDERFNEVVLDGLCVSPDDIIGPLHGGWSLLTQALSIERTGLDFYVKVRRWLDMIVSRAIENGRIHDPLVAQQVAVLQAEVAAGGLMAWRVIDKLSRGEIDEVASAMSKWYNSELGRQIVRLGFEVEGFEGTLSRWDQESPLDGLIDAMAREAPGLTLAAGTSEIMLYLISSELKLQQ